MLYLDMDRLQKFEQLKMHAWYKNQFAKLKSKNIDFCLEFINENLNLETVEFRKKVNRLFVDSKISSLKKSEQNRLRICQELLDCCAAT
jgi:hypothetical protein